MYYSTYVRRSVKELCRRRMDGAHSMFAFERNGKQGRALLTAEFRLHRDDGKMRNAT